MEFKKGDYVSLDLASPNYAVGIHSEERGKVLCYTFKDSSTLYLDGYSPYFRKKATKKEIEHLKKALVKNKKMYYKGEIIDMPNEI